MNTFEKLGMELETTSVSPVTYLSLFAYVLLVSYPFLKDAFKWEEKAWFSSTMLLSSVLFIFFPSVVLSPLLSYNGYGVVMLPWDYDYEPILTAFGAVSLGVIAGMVFLAKRGIQLRRSLMETIPLASLALLLPYIGVYAYSLVYASLSWYRHSPYLVFLMVLLFFLILSFVLVSLRWISNFIRSGVSFELQMALFYSSRVLLLTSPSVYSRRCSP